ncbi:MAG: pilus assembly protein PilM [Nitrospirae bacterium]|nr:pilus assembly protein PilM [Candidatus Troglogloeales bacterium]MBI3598666.1 pilus assembly protein PilM [Candidatus Troglogloeales bacterium]
MKKITLGLDIGQYAIKGARIQGGLMGRRPTSFFEKRMTRGQASDSFHPFSEMQRNMLQELVSEGKIQPSDSIAVALPGHLVSTKEITLPFTDKDKIKKTLYFEAEGQLLLDMDEVILDYQTLLSVPGVTKVLVFAASKTMIRKFLDGLLSVGIDPAIVSVDQVALYRYCLWMNAKTASKEKDQEQVVIDLGATKTVLCGMSGKTLRWARTTPMGVDIFIEFLQGECNLTWQEAEALSNELSRPGELQGKALAVFVRGFSLWLNDIEVSLKKTELSPSVGIHLCGGARVSLRAAISSALHRDIIVQKGLGAVHEEQGVSSTCFAQAAGLALLSPDAVNFRSHEFVHSKEIITGGYLISTGVSLLFLLSLFVVNISLHARDKEKKFDLKKQELTTAFQSSFPETQNVVDEIKQSEAMITDIKKRSDLLGIGTQSPLLILKMITDAIPNDLTIYVNEFTVEGGRVQLEAQTTSFDFVDKIKNALMKVDSFEDVTVGDARVTSDPARIGFRMQVSVKRLKTAKQPL